ncbi:YfjI family protein [Ruminococcus sp. HUN007]|uniref:YfjI family protein n=1 Tax=Ruminococcus sp. HUN007 TaxID=1514668 RepID=UPI0005D20237|nr:YfjI family protein [Ruminococcus sp. HUN007]
MTNEIRWVKPTPLRSDGANLLKFPVNALPPVIADMADAVAATTSTDVAMAGTSILSAVSYCFSGVYRMAAKRDHTEPLVLDTLTIAEPSFKKSPVISLIKKPYTDFTRDWNKKHTQEYFTAQSKRKLLENKLEALEKKNDVTAEEIADLQIKLSNIPAGNLRRITVDDVTPESLVKLLEENGTLLMISDEAGMLGNFSGRYSNNIPNLDLLLKTWNGETYISDRATRSSIILPKPYMSICLACQPYVFEGLISNPTFRGSGLTARFLYCFPESNIGFRKYDTPAVPEAVSENYRELICKLLSVKFAYHDETEQYLHFDSKAYSEFVDYYNNFIEPHLITDMAFCKDWGGKYHGELLRLCGIIHCIRCALNNSNPAETPVTLDTFCNAVEIGEYFREQAIYAYSLGDVDLGTIKAEKVLAKIRSRHITNIRQNDLYKLCRCTLFRNAADFGETMDMLEEYNYLRREKVEGANGNNKSGTMVFINPLI